MSLAIVTGGATGIGAAAVRKYASEGYDIALLDVEKEESLKLRQEEHPGSVAYFETDVRDRKKVEASVASAVDTFGPPSVLFANAGIQRLSSLFELGDEDIDAVIDTNLKGTLYAVAAAAPHMREAGEGSIVLMASDQVFAGKPGSIAYGASKGGIGQLAKSLSLELSPLGIRINAICPATVKTPLTDKIFKDLGNKEYEGDTEAAWNTEAESIPLGRIASPEEIANVVYFLGSSEASFMTGSLVTVDGGFTAQ
ncbi:MAG: SDR family oxidoreductase [Verrucomicrobiota bacterium]|nr:SDR family oxidoreductase [Verrucomicrobiota bacterium]